MRQRVFVVTFFIVMVTLVPTWAGRNIVSEYGQLQIIDHRICDSQGNSVQLKGISTHGLQWFPITENQTISNMLDLFDADVVRAAMYVKEWDGEEWAGYLDEYNNVNVALKENLKAVIRDAIDEGIYVIVDWHLHWYPYSEQDHYEGTAYTDQAVAFFNEIANTTYNGKPFKDYPNVIWEVMNEPSKYITWQQIKEHSNRVIQELRTNCNDSDNLILVPPNDWAKNIEEISKDQSEDRPDRQYSNIAYTLHFYAASHKNEVRDKANAALITAVEEEKLTIFVSEWGIGDYTGGGDPDWDSSLEWITWMEDNKISWVSWNFSDKDETSAMLFPGSGMTGPWNTSHLTTSGEWIRDWLGTNNENDPDKFDSNGYYKITSVHSNLSLAVEYWGYNDGTNIVQQNFNYQDTQLWQIIDIGGGKYKIINKHSGKAIDVAEFSYNNGGNVHQWGYVGQANQHWKVTKTGSNEYTIIADHSNKSLDVAEYSYSENGNIHQWDFIGHGNQYWKIEKVY